MSTISTDSRTVPFIFFGSVLKSYEIPYDHKSTWLYVNCGQPYQLEVYLSCRILSSYDLLKQVAPILWLHKISFVVLESNYAVNNANGNGLGQKYYGQFITLRIKSEQEAKKILTILWELTEYYEGPCIPGTVRIGKIIYLQKSRPKDNLLKAGDAFKIAQKYKTKRRRILGKYYVPVQQLGALAKGDTYKCINIRRLSFNWCLVKEGKRNTHDDFFGRDMIDRMHWQFKVLSQIQGFNIAPKPISFFSDAHAAYLVIEYIEGDNLRIMAEKIRGGNSFKELEVEKKIALLNLYHDTLRVISALHQLGIIHRDINADNIIHSYKGKIFLVDFELAYNVLSREPMPPFGHGTFGFMSPQQRLYKAPRRDDDVYSLGAVLIFILTGKHPLEFVEEKRSDLQSFMKEYTDNPRLADICFRSTSPDREGRPSLDELIFETLKELESYHGEYLETTI